MLSVECRVIAGSPREYSRLLVMVSWLGLTHIKEIGLSVIQKEEERGLSFVSEIKNFCLYVLLTRILLRFLQREGGTSTTTLLLHS